MSDIDGHDDIPEVTLGWRLRIAMERAGLKAEEMADELGVHRGTITRWTHDIGSPPRAIYLHRWADLCRVSYGWLLGDTHPTERSVVGRAVGSSSRMSSASNRGCMTTTRRRDAQRGVSCDADLAA